MTSSFYEIQDHMQHVQGREHQNLRNPFFLSFEAEQVSSYEHKQIKKKEKRVTERGILHHSSKNTYVSASSLDLKDYTSAGHFTSSS